MPDDTEHWQKMPCDYFLLCFHPQPSTCFQQCWSCPGPCKPFAQLSGFDHGKFISLTQHVYSLYNFYWRVSSHRSFTGSLDFHRDSLNAKCFCLYSLGSQQKFWSQCSVLSMCLTQVPNEIKLLPLYHDSYSHLIHLLKFFQIFFLLVTTPVSGLSVHWK